MATAEDFDAALMELRVKLYVAAQLLKGDALGELKTLIRELFVVLDLDKECHTANAIDTAQAEDVELATARLEVALDSLTALQRIIQRTGGWMAHEDQHSLRVAEAVLVAAGRKVER